MLEILVTKNLLILIPDFREEDIMEVELIIEKLFQDRPKFHTGETEIQRNFLSKDSYLDRQSISDLLENKKECYGIDIDLAKFLSNNINSNSNTLEIGAGISTILFSSGGGRHVSITPNKNESLKIKEYCNTNGFKIDNTEFIYEESHKILPKAHFSDIDIVLIDGKHAFPWPIIDWFYTSNFLKKNGYMILDDIQMASVGILIDFLMEDPGWEIIETIKDKSIIFEKKIVNTNDVAWHMQPYIMKRLVKNAPQQEVKPSDLSVFLSRMLGKLKK